MKSIVIVKLSLLSLIAFSGATRPFLLRGGSFRPRLSRLLSWLRARRRAVFQQVARVIRAGGLYHLHCANPFFIGLSGKDWNGEGYALKRPYIDGAEVTCEDQDWVYDRSKAGAPILPPREYRHTLSTLSNALIEQGFVVLHISNYSGFPLTLKPNPGHGIILFQSRRRGSVSGLPAARTFSGERQSDSGAQRARVPA